MPTVLIIHTIPACYSQRHNMLRANQLKPAHTHYRKKQEEIANLCQTTINGFKYSKINV
jgi:D-lyxose ketol-isomerase